MTQRIYVEVSGGTVQHVQIPPNSNVVVIIVDYDNEGDRDQYGQECSMSEWEPDEQGPPDREFVILPKP